jgi:Putative addiction module component
VDAKQVLIGALRLSDEERATLVGEMIRSLDHDVDLEVEAAWSEEIRARVEPVDKATAEPFPRRRHVVPSTLRPVVTCELD